MALAIPEMLAEMTEDFDQASILANTISDELPVTVRAIDNFWKARRGYQGSTMQTVSKVGRNEPG